MSKKQIIFLDFDGVLHPVSAYANNTSFLEYTEALFDIIDHAPVVVSSSWRLTYTLDELQEMLCPLNVIGTTEAEDNPMTYGSRQREIEKWMYEHPGYADYEIIALDDMENLFYKECELLLLCDGEEGLKPGSKAYEELKERVK